MDQVIHAMSVCEENGIYMIFRDTWLAGCPQGMESGYFRHSPPLSIPPRLTSYTLVPERIVRILGDWISVMRVRIPVSFSVSPPDREFIIFMCYGDKMEPSSRWQRWTCTSRHLQIRPRIAAATAWGPCTSCRYRLPVMDEYAQQPGWHREFPGMAIPSAS